MLIHLYDRHIRHHFLPFTYTRTVADIRVGIYTIREKWEKIFKVSTASITVQYLQELFPEVASDTYMIVSANVFPNQALADWCANAKLGDALKCNGKMIAACVAQPHDFEQIEQASEIAVTTLDTITQIFGNNDAYLHEDFKAITQGRTSATLSSSNTIIGDNIFIEEGAKVEASILNSTTGAIYIGKHAEIMEGSIVRGALAMCEGSQLKLATKIYGATTLGPGCKVGGEVNNAVFFANSSKAHDGFIGNAVIGEWCNLGADTNCSNLKNNYEEVKIWSEHEQRFVKTGLQFCGLMMGDHSKCGINTMFNTGTVVGVSANIFGAGFPRNVIPSFSWGGALGTVEYKLDKAMQTMKAVYARRNKELSDAEMRLYAQLYAITQDSRKNLA
ncbi:MAG: hypothetical protein RL660_1576 [Bacteroidota bacterium]|jgi:UDP-N-acetylglucosamine diphosphorylase/glucosamine-1-phosphate N-acetyltransferase